MLALAVISRVVAIRFIALALEPVAASWAELEASTSRVFEAWLAVLTQFASS